MKRLSFLITTVLLLTLTFNCNKQKKTLTTTNSEMIKLNNDDYTQAWKTIDSLEQRRLPKSALEKVQELYAQVQKDENPAQTIKCLIYLGKYQSQLEENGFIQTLRDMETHIFKANFPENKILESMIGELYQRYLDQQYWKLRDRTELSDFKPDDIQTWTIGQLTEQSRMLYWSSINDDRTKQIKLDDFQAILIKSGNAEGLQSTLYDFLVNRAIAHFSNERNYLSKPAYQFFINQPEALGDINEFLKMNFESRDSTADKLAMLRLFQDILTFHKDDTEKNALIYNDLRRLKFVYDNSVIPNKQKIYLETLEKLEQQNQDDSIVADITYYIAQYYYTEGSNAAGDESKQFYLKTAYEICEKAIQKHPDSYGAGMCRSIQSQIVRKELSFVTESVNLPNQPFLLNINYRNVSKVYGRVIRISDKTFEKIEQMDYDSRDDYFKTLDPLSGFSFDLPQVGDYRSHRAEIKMEALPFGRYLIMLSNGKDLEDQSVALQFLYCNVSNIAMAQRTNSAGNTEYVLTHRATGDPMQGVTAEFYEQKYNNVLRKHVSKKLGSALSNANGIINTASIKARRFNVKFSKGDDHLNLNTSASNYARSYDRNANSQISFFLDRAIYRPGQTVYFKGIAIAYDKKGMPTILTNRPVKVELRDVNNQVAETLELRTNEYGTINGTFTAPQNGLTGQMSMRAIWEGNASSKYFRVEEYKRPKFEVTFDPVKGSFTLNETVAVTGKAKAYAGSNVDGAKVVYRVVRTARFPYYPWWRWGGYRPTSPSVEITNGETVTDATGAFEINFEALSDPSLTKTQRPEYNYQITADVIDITGETHTANANVTVGSVALKVGFDVQELTNADSLKSTTISTTNLNGQFEAAKGTLTIEKLKSPNRAFVKRFWLVPDQYILTQSDYQKEFPNYAFKRENEVQKWPVESNVFSGNFDTNNSKELSFNNLKFAPGKYAFTLKTKDAFGEDIELKRFVTVYDLRAAKVPANEPYFHVAEQENVEPGETFNWHIGSFNENQKMLVEIEFDNKIIESKWLTVSGLKKESKAIEEQHRGGLSYHVLMTHNNRTITNSYAINVPWTNKELTFEYGTFRDKLYPGQDETWQIKISGPKKDKLAAEMLAGMYDASLDAFAPNSWGLSPFPYNYRRFGWRSLAGSSVGGRELHYNWDRGIVSGFPSRYLSRLNWFNFNSFEFYEYVVHDRVMEESEMAAPTTAEPRSAPREKMKKEARGNLANGEADKSTATVSGVMADDEGVSEVKVDLNGEETTSDNPPQIRTNLKETVFFFPNLQTDEEGNVLIQFTMNEALTKWKFMGLAHTKDLKIGTTTKEIVTQKDLMVLPNPPRFFREGDEIEFTAKVSNLTEQEMNGTATLQLFDAISMQPIDAKLQNTNNRVSFKALPGQSDRLAWKLKIPIGQLGAITHRVVAKAGSFSDGEESALPVLTNRMLVTETKPLPVRGNETKDFTFKAMEKAARSNTLTHHKMTLEFTANPAWYAVQALPYLMEYPYECTEQIFSRYYSNALASSVANAHPKVKRVFEAWKGTPIAIGAMESNLSKNQELKSALLEETPWVLNAQSEEQQRRNIGLLFDLNRMSRESQKALNTIADRQSNSGGFAWFPGGRDSWYITQYIVEGMGHLNELGVKDLKDDRKTSEVIRKSLSFIDYELRNHYDDLVQRLKRNKGKLSDDHLDRMAIHYLYARSYFRDVPVESAAQTAFDYYKGQAEKYWIDKGMYSEGMIALALQRYETKSSAPQDIVKSLKERSLNNEELGMYWKYKTGYYWYQLPIETHALMIEVFEEVAQDEQAVDDLKVWLLKNKQTNHWKTTKATASAVYALLRRGDNWLLEDQPVQITLGNEVLDQSKIAKEAGTGYFKTSWDGDDIKNDMSQIKVQNPNKVVAWGAMYWQYFEQLDKIETFEETPLTINKKLFKVSNSPTGEQMALLDNGAQLNPGDKLRVRIELRVDRAMEYIHLKDMRASGFEPISVLSQYKYQGGLGYYESTRDAATNFFIGYLPKGTYVFEYTLRVVHKGDFSNGITTIQSMYAPEFTSHSEGIRVSVGE